jgi:ribosomal protein S18 acetylase RimI-like enzyme
MVREYRDWMAGHPDVLPYSASVLRRGFALFDGELANFPGEYAPPSGELLVAWAAGRPVGCAAIRRVRPGVAELKRVYVRPRFRGLRLGRRLTVAAIRVARRRGYRRLVLDTLPTMTAAIGLYRTLGFVAIPAYWDHPAPGALFFGLRLWPSSRHRGSG